MLGASLILTLLTVMNFFLLPRYAPAGDPVQIVDAEGLVIHNADPEATVRHDFPVPLTPGAPHYEVTVNAESKNIVGGDYGWYRGRLVLLQYENKKKARWDLPHVVALIEGEQRRRTFDATFLSSPNVTHLVARLELMKATGTLTVHEFTVRPMVEAPGFAAASQFILWAWIALLVMMLAWLMLRLNLGRWVTLPLAGVAGTALVLSILPADFAAPAKAVAVGTIDLVSSSKATAQEKTAAVAFNFFRIAKGGHFLMFMAVGFMFALARGQSHTLAIWGCAVWFAGLCELLQLFSPNRWPKLFDLWLNTGGATAGFLVALAALWLWQRFGLSRRARLGYA